MDKYGEDKKVATACKILDEGFEDAMQVMVLPENIRQRLRTTNVLERLNEEVRRRERVVRIFPNCDSVIRIIGALLMEKDDEWTSAPRKYLEFDRNEISFLHKILDLTQPLWFLPCLCLFKSYFITVLSNFVL